MLTHENVVSDAAGVIKGFEVHSHPLMSSCSVSDLVVTSLCATQTTIIPSTEDVSISFLPLAHMFERVVQVRSHTTVLRLWVYRWELIVLFCFM